MAGMNPSTPVRPRSRTVSVLLYTLALLLVMLAPLLGVVAALVGAWHALLAGWFWYLPPGFMEVLLLAVTSATLVIDWLAAGLALLL
jgi:hypothetical protein